MNNVTDWYLWVDWNGSPVHLQTSCHGLGAERLAILVWQCHWQWWCQRLAAVPLGGTDFLRILFDGVGCRFSDGDWDFGVGFFVGSGGSVMVLGFRVRHK